MISRLWPWVQDREGTLAETIVFALIPIYKLLSFYFSLFLHASSNLLGETPSQPRVVVKRKINKIHSAFSLFHTEH